MFDVIICGALILFGFSVLALGWVWIECVQIYKEWRQSRYRGKHLK